MPALSSTMTEGKVVEWLKKPKDRIVRGESLLVVESDKADMDVEAFHEGFLAIILAPAGSITPVGKTIGLIVDTEAEIVEAQGRINQDLNENSEVFKSADSIPTINKKNSSIRMDNSSQSNDIQSLGSNNRLTVSPRAKKLAIQLGVNLSDLKGSGLNGRIQAEDVQQAAQQPFQSIIASPGHFISPYGKNDNQTPRLLTPLFTRGEQSNEIVPFTTLQQVVNRNMMESLTIPCFRVSYTIITDKLDSIYQKVKKKGITMTTLLVKAIGLTLTRHPQINAATVDMGISYSSCINIAIAVATDDGGLLTPVLIDVNNNDIYTLSRSWTDLVNRAKNKQLKPDEYSKGTFTVSNLGMFGVDSFDAILPSGTGSILAIASSSPHVVVNQDGSISIKRQMKVNLTCDHRVIYGAHAAAFLKDLAELIEIRPESLMF